MRSGNKNATATMAAATAAAIHIGARVFVRVGNPRSRSMSLPQLRRRDRGGDRIGERLQVLRPQRNRAHRGGVALQAAFERDAIRAREGAEDVFAGQVVQVVGVYAHGSKHLFRRCRPLRIQLLTVPSGAARRAASCSCVSPS